MKLDDLRISTKVALPTIILAVVALACTGIGLWQTKQVEDASRTMMQQRLPAEVMSARFNRRLSVIGYAAYRTLALGGDAAVAQRASDELDTAYNEGKDSLRAMVEVDPATARSVAVFDDRLDGIYTMARNGADLALGGRPQEAKPHLAKLDAAITSLSVDAKRWGDGYHDQTGQMVAAAGRRAEIGRWFGLALGLAAAAAGTVFALWIGATKIARPVGHLAKAMDALSSTGELDAPVDGTERGDEIGVMARSFVVFRDNAQALRSAQAADLAKSEFVANMSHEIRTPLNGVLGMTQAIEADELTPAQRERVAVVRESGQALLAVLNDVLDLSKIEAGKLELAPAPFDLERVLRAACATFESTAAAKDVELRLILGDDITGAWLGDGQRLRQVVSNLVSNAVKFTEHGHVEVSAERREPMLVLTVRDTGVGIDAEHLPKLFGKFTQADATTTRRYGGTGLGLSISRQLIELMGGEITVASTKGVGTCFTTEVPLERLAAEFRDEEPAAYEALSGVAERPLRILAAEDNAINQRVLSALLEPTGAELTLVSDGRAAVEAFRAGGFDLVLMDIQMPEMNGLDATRAIRAHEAAAGLPATPILALSANVMTHQLEEYVAVGMQGHVAKPIEAERLYAGINAALQPQAAADVRAA